MQRIDLEQVEGGSSRITLSRPMDAKGTVRPGDVRHLLLQFSTEAACCIDLTLVLANQQKRHTVP